MKKGKGKGTERERLGRRYEKRRKVRGREKGKRKGERNGDVGEGARGRRIREGEREEGAMKEKGNM